MERPRLFNHPIASTLVAAGLAVSPFAQAPAGGGEQLQPPAEHTLNLSFDRPDIASIIGGKAINNPTDSIRGFGGFMSNEVLRAGDSLHFSVPGNGPEDQNAESHTGALYVRASDKLGNPIAPGDDTFDPHNEWQILVAQSRGEWVQGDNGKWRLDMALTLPPMDIVTVSNILDSHGVQLPAEVSTALEAQFAAGVVSCQAEPLEGESAPPVVGPDDPTLTEGGLLKDGPNNSAFFQCGTEAPVTTTTVSTSTSTSAPTTSSPPTSAPTTSSVPTTLESTTSTSGPDNTIPPSTIPVTGNKTDIPVKAAATLFLFGIPAVALTEEAIRRGRPNRAK